MQRRMLLALSIVVTLAAPAYSQLRDGRDNPLAAARDLYASARYDEALAVLNGLPKDNAVADRKSVEQYRSLCLLALGRGAEAESAIAAVVTADPLFVPGEADASPRVRTAFSDVRQRLLPQIVQTRYAAAKAAFERKEWDAAQSQFRDLLTLLDDPQMGGKQGDLRTLAKGFLDLAVAAAAPPPEPKRADPPPPAQAAAPAPRVDKIWSADEPGVVLPVIIRQEVPRVPVNIARQVRDRGMLEIVIDEQGRVISMAVRMSMHPIYDPLLLSAARDWRYKPATVNGTPVKFRKIIQITIDKR
jgi:TonB family protein